MQYLVKYRNIMVQTDTKKLYKFFGFQFYWHIPTLSQAHAAWDGVCVCVCMSTLSLGIYVIIRKTITRKLRIWMTNVRKVQRFFLHSLCIFLRLLESKTIFRILAVRIFWTQWIFGFWIFNSPPKLCTHEFLWFHFSSDATHFLSVFPHSLVQRRGTIKRTYHSTTAANRT